MQEKYEVTSNYGACIFHSREDAASALWLLSHYHNYDLRRENVCEKLGRDGLYEAYPLSARKIFQ